MTIVRSGVAAVGFAFLALSGAACNLIDFDSRNLQNNPPVDDEPRDMPPPEPPRMCTPVIAEMTPEYEVMCRHYCNELDATLAYLGKSQEPPGAVAQSCWEVRCVPRCVTHQTCSSQCHSIGYAYQEMCRDVEIGLDSICPVTAFERAEACLAGCDLWTPPPEDPPPPKP